MSFASRFAVHSKAYTTLFAEEEKKIAQRYNRNVFGCQSDIVTSSLKRICFLTLHLLYGPGQLLGISVVCWSVPNTEVTLRTCALQLLYLLPFAWDALMP